MDKEELRNNIIKALKKQGFRINPHVRPFANTKAAYRALQEKSREEQILKQFKFLKNNINKVKNYILNIKNFDPARIDLELREVKNGSLEEVIFKWWNLIWWSIPYQRAYGRQMRFLLWDKRHNVPFGLIGLQSPVLKMSIRDKYLELPKEELDIWVNKSMQAQRIGALPPFNSLLGGKMVALSLISEELRQCYIDKYKDRITIIKNRFIKPELLFITTTSAFGRSSIYNRLKYKKQPVAISLGYTKGSGTFHIPDSLYKKILEFLKENNIETKTTFGYGPSRKIKLLNKAFKLLNLPDYSYHNLKREFFLFPLVDNLKNVILKKEKPRYYKYSLNELVEFWKERWCIPRANRFDEWKYFDSQKFFNELLIKNGLYQNGKQ